MIKTLRDWGIRSSHWTVGHHLYRIAELEVGGDEPHSHVSFVQSVVDKFEAIADLPIPFFQPELEMIRPNNVVLLTTRNPQSWIRSFRAWLLKSCKSVTFQGCPGRTNNIPGSSMLMVDACPANLLAFGNTCPSDIQALKRMHVHNFMTMIMTPKPFLVSEDVTVANSTFHMCVTLKLALQKRRMYIMGTKAMERKRRLNRRDSSGSFSHEFFSDKELWTHPRESSKPRSLQQLFDLLDCSPKETFAAANVNKALKRQQRGGFNTVAV